MSVALTNPWTAEQFLDWASTQEGRYEFDGLRPVAMTAGTANHDRITQNIAIALRSRLRGSRCSNFGPTMSIHTIYPRLRNPDALINCTPFSGTDLFAPDPVVVFEVLSPSSGFTDRIVKVAEYQAVPSIACYVIVESDAVGLQVLHRLNGGDPWTVYPLEAGATLALQEVGIEVPVSAFYEDIVFGETTADA